MLLCIIKNNGIVNNKIIRVMKRFFTTLSVVILALTVNGANPTEPTANPEALSKMNSEEMINLMVNLDTKSSILVAEKWLERFEDNVNIENNVVAYTILADGNYFEGNYSQADKYYHKLVNIKKEKAYENIWNVFKLGLCKYELNKYEDMKRICMSAINENCIHFGVTIEEMWNGQVVNDDIALMLYHFSLALYQVKGGKADADAAMQLAAKCGLKKAQTFVKAYNVPCKPAKSVLFGE